MERETGFEPATSSLGISASIAYKGHGVHGGDTDPWSFSNLPPLLPQRPLNGVETECEAAFNSLYLIQRAGSGQHGTGRRLIPGPRRKVRADPGARNCMRRAEIASGWA